MLEIDTSGIAAYTKWLDEQAAALELAVREAYRSWAVKIHASITELSPQWSGNMAANWMLDVGAVTSSADYYFGEAGDQPYVPGGCGGRGGLFSRGMEPAVGISLNRAKQTLVPLLSDSLFIHNPVDYAQRVEDDTSDPRIRGINRLPREETGIIAMVAYAYTQFSVESTV